MFRVVLIVLTLWVYNYTLSAGTYTYKEGVGLSRIWETGDEGRYYRFNAKAYQYGFLYYKKTESDTHYVSFLTGDWAISHTNVCSFFPSKSEHENILKTELPVSYVGQTQKANNDASHLVSYDFMTGSALVEEYNAEFTLSHLGAVLRIVYKSNKVATVNELSLQINKESWKTEGKVNAVEETFTAEKYDDTVRLFFDNVNVSQDENMIAYVFVSPLDLSDDTMTVNISFADGTSVVKKVKGTEIKAGKMYNVNLSGSIDDYVSVYTQAKEVSALIGEESSSLQLTSTDREPRFYVPDITEETDEDNQFSLIQTPVFGDVNGDGYVTMADANLVVNYFLSGETLDETRLTVVDVNGDGNVTMADANMIVNIFLTE